MNLRFPEKLSIEDCTDLIVNDLKKVILPEGMFLEVTNTWKLQQVDEKFSQKLIFLKSRENPDGIGVLEFYINHLYIDGSNSTKFIITIKTIKGKKRASIPPNTKWREILMGSFIKATTPILVNYDGSQLFYYDVSTVRNNLEKYKKLGYVQEVDANDKEKKEFKRRLLQKIRNKEVSLGKQSIDDLVEEINHSELMYKGVNIVRNLYFDKDGYLNPSKERVKEIFKTYQDKRQTELTGIYELGKRRKEDVEKRNRLKKMKTRVKLL